MANYDYPGSSPTYGVTLNNGDVMKVMTGGYAASVTVNAGGLQLVQGGTTSAVTINVLGSQQVDSGTVQGVAINTGGVVHLNGGRIDNPFVNGGALYVGAGGTVAQTNVTNGGTEYLSGSTIASTAMDGGRIILDQPGYQGQTVTNPNITQNFIGRITIQMGGALEIKNGVVSGLQLEQGGNVVIDSLRYDTSVTSSYDTRTGTLTIQGVNGSYKLGVFDQPGKGASDFVLSAAPSGAVNVTPVQQPVCFLAGSRLSTPSGDVIVEEIRPGQLVYDHEGRERPVVWIGGGRVSASEANRPVIVKRHAFAPGMPSVDLAVTAGHSFLFDGFLVPIGELVNGVSIYRDVSRKAFDYFHVQLDEHAILVVNGALAESYRDDGNRIAFEWGLGEPAANNDPFAEIATEGAVVDALWQRFSAMAGVQWPELSTDPDVHLLVGGRRHDPVAASETTYLFKVNQSHGEIRLETKHIVAAEIGLSRDHRSLGVAVRRYWFEGDQDRSEISFDSPLLRDGFHAAEESSGFRWTNGSAILQGKRASGSAPILVGVEIGCKARYN